MLQDFRLGAREARTNSPLSKLVPLAFLVALLWMSADSAAQTNTQAGGTDAANLAAKVDALFANYNKSDSPGCTVGVIKDGKLIYTRGYGMANLEHNIPNGPQIVYDIGSMSKQFTAASILLLAAQGKLSLDDNVRKYIAELPEYQQPITIRHLLHHTSGLRDYAALFGLAGSNFEDASTDDDALKMIARQKALNFTPGDEWLYSNSGFFLLSVIVKRVSGKTLAEFAQEQLFDPLGMKSTLYLDNHKRIVPRRATGYTAAERPSAGGSFQIEMSNFEQTGDGAVQSTIEDLLWWDQNFYEPKVGSRALLDQLQTVGTLNNGQKLDYALGIYVDEYKGLRRVWHSGAWAGYRSNLTRFHDQKFSVACLCNVVSANTTQLALRIADLYLADQFKAATAQSAQIATTPAPVTVAEEELKRKLGLYYNPTTGGLRRVTLRDGKLRIDAFTPNSFELIPLSPDRFRHAASGNEIIFAMRPDSKLQLLLTTRQGTTEIFEPVAAATPGAAELAEYVGSYFSEELDTVYQLRIEQGKLQFFMKDGQGHPLQPTFRDGFTFSGASFEFKRDAQGKVSGFVYGAGSIRNLSFARQRK
jgi:CubicO group peptidase (beta-lactamase class C family)